MQGLGQDSSREQYHDVHDESLQLVNRIATGEHGRGSQQSTIAVHRAGAEPSSGKRKSCTLKRFSARNNSHGLGNGQLSSNSKCVPLSHNEKSFNSPLRLWFLAACL